MDYELINTYFLKCFVVWGGGKRKGWKVHLTGDRRCVAWLIVYTHPYTYRKSLAIFMSSPHLGKI